MNNKDYQHKISVFASTLLIWLLLIIPCQLNAQQSLNQIKKQAEFQFEQNKFAEALALYEQYNNLKANNIEVQLRLAICAFEANQLEKAENYINTLLKNSKKSDPQIYFYAAQISHHRLNYARATQFYKLFLKESKLNNEKRPFVIAQIKRCGVGVRNEVERNDIFVEHLVSTVNSKDNDFNPVYSPNFTNRIYFSSDRTFIREYEDGNSDLFERSTNMFFTELQEGVWSIVSELNPDLNTQHNEILVDFNDDGTVVYFGRETERDANFLCDTFSNVKTPEISNPLNQQIKMAKGDRDLYFFADSILVFSSNSRRGFGGYDIFICRKHNGSWTEPVNLGEKINSSYDEVSPFLAKDGRTLYFSSNNESSIGGFDIFSSKFNDKLIRWEPPRNMGSKLNSPADDLYLKIGPNGYAGIFSSNRKTGIGGFDLYNVYFQNAINGQIVQSDPHVFDQVQKKQPLIKPVLSGYEKPIFDESSLQEILISSIYYEEQGPIVNSRNKAFVDQLSRTLLRYPKCEVLVSVFGNFEGPKHLDLFFSYKKAQQLRDYLIDQGVKAEQIKLRSSGSNYTIIDENTGKRIENLNRRVDFTIQNYDFYPIKIKYNTINPDQISGASKWAKYADLKEGLSYRLQVAAVNQMYNDVILTEYEDPSIESGIDQNTFTYTVGLYKTYEKVQNLKNQLERSGHTSVFILPYMHGIRISGEELNQYLNDYPDLYNFINASK